MLARDHARPVAARAPSASRARGAGSRRRDGRGRYLAAGEILGIGLACFALWLVLDARQLFNAAQSSPLGVRRSVAMTILRPIARAEELFSLDRLVNAADDALGRSQTTPGNGAGTVAPVVASSLPDTTTPARSRGGASAPTTLPKTGPPGTGAPRERLAQPSAAHPLTILDVGDSIGMDLGSGLADSIGTDPAVHLVQDSVGDTGLANAAYFDWLATLPREIGQLHPKVVVVMLGGNDWQPFFAGPTKAVPGTAFWRSEYAARVAAMMSEATRAGALVEWVGLPPMSPASGLAHAAVALDAIYRAEARLHPGVTYFSSWKLFSNAAGQYSQYLPNAAGDLVAVRDPDGIHIAPPAGEDLLGGAVLKAMAAQWHVRL